MEISFQTRNRWNLEGEWNAESIVSDIELDYCIEGTAHKTITGISSIDKALENDLTFCSYEGEKGIFHISASRAGIMLCSKNLRGRVNPKAWSQLVFVDNPRLVFVRFVNRVIKGDIKTATISETAKISKTSQIGNNCRIGDFARIGDNCIIENSVTIEDRVSIVQNCHVGEGCIIQSGTVIGSDGFAYERHSNGGLEKFPHLGGVIIGKNVEICANCSIARGSLSNTIIGDGTKIDALVHIAHNVTIGRNCQLTAGTVIGGSTIVGDACWTGLNSTLKNKIKIGNNVIVGAGACVIADVYDNDIVAGVPARSIKNKVTTKEIFIMAGQTEQQKQPLLQKKY